MINTTNLFIGQGEEEVCVKMGPKGCQQYGLEYFDTMGTDNVILEFGLNMTVSIIKTYSKKVSVLYPCGPKSLEIIARSV